MNLQHLRILFVEDLPADAELAQHTLRKEGLEFEAVVLDTRDAFLAALDAFQPDLIISDYAMPEFDGMSALALTRSRDAALPFIVLTGSLNEETAVACMKAGASDYVIKDRMARLPFAVRESLEQYRLRMEKQAAEKALREREELYRTILQSLPDGVLVTDLQGHITYVSERALELAGLASAEQAIGSLALDLIAPADRARAARRMQDALQSQACSYHEFTMARKDGNTFVGEMKATAMRNSDGTPTRVVSILRDVTARKETEEALRQSESRYRSLFEDASIAIWEQDLSALTKFLGDVRSAGVADINTYLDAYPQDLAYCAGLFRAVGMNRECRAMFHVDRQDAIDIKLADYFTGDSWQVFRELIVALAQGEKRFEGEISIHHPSGNTRHISIQLAVAPLYQADLARVLVSLTDVTERRQRERELQAISVISAALRLVSTRAEMLAVVVQEMARLVDAEAAAIGSYDPNTGEAVHEVDQGTWEHVLEGVRIPAGMGVTGYVRAHKKSYITSDLVNEPLFYSREFIGRMQSLVCMPLLTSEGDLVGWLSAGVHRAWTPEDLQILTAISNIAATALHRATLDEQLEQRVRRLDALHSNDMAIISNADSGSTLDTLLENVTCQLGVDAADILRLDAKQDRLEYTAGYGFRSPPNRHPCLSVPAELAERVAECRAITLNDDLSDETSLCPRRLFIRQEEFASHVGALLVIKGQIKGVLEVFHRAPLNPGADWIEFFQTLAAQAAVALDNMSLFENLQRSHSELIVAYDSTLMGWSRALDLRDKETEGHSMRVTELSVRLARAMGLPEDGVTAIHRGALLHDIGKLGVPDRILHKPGPLTRAEWKIMQKHPEYAYQMLAPIHYLDRSLEIPYCHHEKWDGTGYPRGLEGEQIPITARIFAIADVWDALRSDRSYRAAWTCERAIEYIRNQSGIHFDPRVVSAFFELLESSTE